MKVCHITSAHNSNDVRIFHRQCVSLANAGYDTYLVAQGQSREEKGVKVIGVGDVPTNRLKRMFFFSRLVIKKALEIDADIYQIHDPELLSFAKQLKRKGKKVIFDSHEFYGYQIMHKSYIPKFLRQLASSFYMRYEAHLCKKIDSVIYVCTVNGKNYFENRAKKSLSVANYIDTDNFPLQKVDKKTDAIIYAGTISATRGITHLAQAAKKAQVKLILCGTCASSNYMAELLKDFPETIDYRGSVDWNELSKLYNSVKIGVSTLLFKGQYAIIDTLPTKVYEYWWAGLPVIISKTHYANDFFNKFKCGICVDPENTDEIAQAIKFLLANPEEAKKLGENGRRVVIDEYNWNIESKKFLDLYKEL